MLLMGWGMLAQAQAHLFVATTGDDSSNGLTWETAKLTLASALAIAQNATGGAVIHVKVGLYAMPAEVTVYPNVTVIGGYAAGSTGTDQTQRLYPGTNSNWTNTSKVSILDGGYTHRVATVSAGGRLEGCIVKHGRTSGNGAGVLIDGGTVSHCVLLNNLAYNTADTTQAKGGGAYVQNNGKLLNCVVSYNRADNGFGVAGTTGDVVNNTITQNSGTHCGTVADYDGNLYETVVIGEQCWMRENLRTTHYANGTEVSYYNPGSSAEETRIFGLLYSWGAAMNGSGVSASNPSGVQGVCPNGWHLPSKAEFQQMTTFLAYDEENCCGGNTTYVAKSLASNENWQTSTADCAVGNNLTTNNRSLFNAQPAGYYFSSFSGMYQSCYFVLSSNTTYTSSNTPYYTYAALIYNGGTLTYATPTYSSYGSSHTANYWGSVRCVKD